MSIALSNTIKSLLKLNIDLFFLMKYQSSKPGKKVKCDNDLKNLMNLLRTP